MSLTDFIAWFALTIALFDLWIHAREHFAKRASLRFTVDESRSRFVNYGYGEPRQCVIIALTIENRSEQPIGITAAYIEASGEKYPAKAGSPASGASRSGLLTDSGYITVRALELNNVLEMPEIQGFGVARGYLYAPITPTISLDFDMCMAVIATPRRRFTIKNIKLKTLPA